MTRRAKVLVLRAGKPDPLDFVVDKLLEEPSIALAWGQPFDLSAGVYLLTEGDEDGDMASVVLLIGCDDEIPAAVNLVRRVRPDIHIVSLSLESGDATVAIRDPECAELVRLLRALIVEDIAELPRPEDNVVQFRFPPARVSLVRGTTEYAEGATANPERSVHARNADIIACALEWADAATQAAMATWSVHSEETPGFARSWESFTGWLNRLSSVTNLSSQEADAAFARFRSFLHSPHMRDVPLVRFAALLNYDELALKLFLIVVAGELDIRFHRMFGVMLGDVGPRAPSVSLACLIIATTTPLASTAQIRIQLAALDRLRALGPIDGADEIIVGADEPLKVNPQFLDWLVTDDPRLLLGDAARAMLRPTPEAALALLPQERLRAVADAHEQALKGRDGRDKVTAILLAGSSPGWIRIEAAALAGTELCFGPTPNETAGGALRKALRSLITAARLTNRRIVVDLSENGPSSDALWTTLASILEEEAPPPLVITVDPPRLLALAPERNIVVVRMAPPTISDRAAAVQAALSTGNDPTLAKRLAEQFPIALDRVPDAIALAMSSAADNDRAHSPSAADWHGGFRAVAGARLPRLARRMEPLARPNDRAFSCLDPVVLPESQKAQLQNIVKHVRLGRTVLDEWGFGALLDSKGVAALFAGESGTGKTMAAHAIASEIGADLYVVDLSQVVSKYIGDTEKNLDIVFDEADQSGAVLLFDEADALFGKRNAVSSAHDRYANIEVSYLLQRMQQFRGLALLTSNLPENLDTAFTRRLRFIVEFPRPNAHDRLQIWKQSLPSDHRASELDLEPIADALDVTGGVIRQIALHAAMFAAYEECDIDVRHLLSGASSELARIGAYSKIQQLRALYPAQEHARAA